MVTKADFGADIELSRASEDQLSILDLVIILAEHWRTIFGMGLAFGAFGLIAYLLLPSRYTAYTAILPPQQSIASGAAIMAQLNSPATMALLSSGGGLGLKNPNDLQVALLRSWTVENAVITRFDLNRVYKARTMVEARYKLEHAVDLDNGAKDGLIRIYVTDRDARRAAELANGYIEEFKKATAKLAVTEASQRRLFFEQQLAQSKDNLAHAEEELKKTEQRAGVIQLDSQARAVIGQIANLRAQIAAKEVQIGSMRSFATGENPALNAAEQELVSLRAQQQKMGSVTDDALNALAMPSGKIQESSLEYVRRLRDVRYFEAIFDLLARQLEAARVDEARQGTTVQVVDLATPPEVRSSPRRNRILVGSTGLGIFLGILWALSFEGFSRLSNNPADHRRLSRLRHLLSPAQLLSTKSKRRNLI